MGVALNRARPRIGLGTAQFGTDYGISNRDGRPSEAEVAAILMRALEAGVGCIDTAAGYGNAETLIGKHLPAGHGLRIVTKLPPIAGDVIEKHHTETILATLAASLERLRTAQVYGVLIHHAGDLGKPGWQHLVGALHEACARGWTSRIGVSVYDAGELALVQSRFTPQIVQLPFNVLDRRLVASGWLARLKAAGTEIHARSLFLQGLLLMAPGALPGFFAPVRRALTDLHAVWAASNRSPLAGCLDFVLGSDNIDVAVIGINRQREFDEIEAALAELDRNDDASVLPFGETIDPIFLDPRQWPKHLP